MAGNDRPLLLTPTNVHLRQATASPRQRTGTGIVALAPIETPGWWKRWALRVNELIATKQGGL